MGTFRLRKGRSFPEILIKLKDEWAAGIGSNSRISEIKIEPMGQYAAFIATQQRTNTIVFGTGIRIQILTPENGYEVEFGVDWNIGQISLKWQSLLAKDGR